MIELSRDEFTHIFYRIDKEDSIISAFENKGSLFKTENYLFVFDGDVSIIQIDTLDKVPKVVNWYKLYHVGRCLNLYGFERKFELYRFLYNAVKELKESKTISLK